MRTRKFVPGGRKDTEGSVVVSGESSMGGTEGLEMYASACRVAVLSPSRSSHRPCPGVRQLLSIHDKSTLKDESVRESMGSRAPKTETDVLSDTISHSPGSVTTDQTFTRPGKCIEAVGIR